MNPEPTIAKFTSVEIRHYRDNGQTTIYVGWIDGKGRCGRTEGAWPTANEHMRALVRCAQVRDSIRPVETTW